MPENRVYHQNAPLPTDIMKQSISPNRVQKFYEKEPQKQIEQHTVIHRPERHPFEAQTEVPQCLFEKQEHALKSYITPQKIPQMLYLRKLVIKKPEYTCNIYGKKIKNKKKFSKSYSKKTSR